MNGSTIVNGVDSVTGLDITVERKPCHGRRSMRLVKECGRLTSLDGIGPDTAIWYNGKDFDLRKVLRPHPKKGLPVVGRVDKVIPESGKIICSFKVPDGEGGERTYNLSLNRDAVSIISERLAA